MADTTLPRLEDTSSGKSGRHSGTLGGFKTLSSFSLATSSAVKSSISPGRLGNTGSVAQKGPTIQNGISWHMEESINGAAWLHSMTRSGNNLEPKWMPLRMRRHPPMVSFLSPWFQLTTDRSHHTTMLLAIIAKPWLEGSQNVILEGSLVFLYSAAYVTQYRGSVVKAICPP